NSSMRKAPPTSSAASSTRVLRPLPASKVAAARPLCPAPMMIASQDVIGFAHLLRLALEIAQDFGRGIAPGSSHHAAAWMGRGAADIEASDRRTILCVTGYGTVEEQLVEGQLALEDVALGQADLVLELLWRPYFHVDDALAKTG